MNPFLQTTRDGAIVVLTMSRPESRNALDGFAAVDEFVQALDAANRDATVRAIVLAAAGPVFCAGGNLKDMERYAGEDMPAEAIQDEYRHGIQRLPRAFQALDVPVIAAVQGPAIGVGCDLACMCDIRIASGKASFAESFVQVGLVPGDGGAWLLPRVVGWSRALEMAFTGEAIDAQQALACGLVSRVVPPEALLDEALALARRMAAHPGGVLRMTKRLFRQAQAASLDQVLELSASYQALAHQGAGHRDAVRAFLSRRRPL